MDIKFDKYQGAGNDFIIMDNLTGAYDEITALQFQSICNRHKGIGSDGIILIESHATLDFEMRYFNSNGNLSSMCGNGARCAVAFASRHNLIKRETRFIAADGIHEAELISANEVRLQMQNVNDLTKKGDAIIMNTGSPHFIVLCNDIEHINVFAHVALQK